MFKCRDERSKKIDQIVRERYSGLIGKFFKADERMKSAMIGDYYYIVDIYACSNYVMSNQVDIELICRSYGTCRQGRDAKVIGVEISNHTFRFRPSDDIIALIGPMLVSKEEVMADYNGLVEEMEKNFLSI